MHWRFKISAPWSQLSNQGFAGRFSRERPQEILQTLPSVFPSCSSGWWSKAYPHCTMITRDITPAASAFPDTHLVFSSSYIMLSHSPQSLHNSNNLSLHSFSLLAACARRIIFAMLYGILIFFTFPNTLIFCTLTTQMFENVNSESKQKDVTNRASSGPHLVKIFTLDL